MKLIKSASAGLVLLTLAATFFASTMMKRPSMGGDRIHKAVNSSPAVAMQTAGDDGHACCHAKAAQNPNQEPGRQGQGEEGNPTHKRPEQSCNHKPEKQQVRCHCQVDCNPDGTEKEDSRCRSYCYKDMCSCPRRPCP